MLTAVQTTASATGDDDSLDFTGMDNRAAPRGRLARTSRATPHLPESFEEFNARDFIEEAYCLATQI